MPRQFSSDWYYEQIVKDAIENPNNRTFTISHVPKEQKADVIKLLKDNYGGNSSDKKLGEAVQKVAAVIPAAAGTIATLPQTTILLLSAMKNPKFWKDVVLPTLGGEVVNEGIKKVSGNKYSGFGDFAYKNSGLDFVENTKAEVPVKIILEGLNPGLQASLIGKGIYAGTRKALAKAAPYIKKTVDNNTTLRKIRYKVNDYLDGVDDLINHIKYPSKPGSKYFDEWKEGAEKTVTDKGIIYTKGNYTMTETPEKVVFTDKDGTFRIGSFTDNSYYVTVTPTLGQTKAPISTVKTVYSVVDKGKPGTYFVADPTSLPKGLILKDLYDNKDYIGIAKNLIGLDDTFKMALSGYSTDAHKYINLFKSNPSVATRYNPVPMTSFNTAGTNTGLYSKLAVADIAENPYVKEAMLRRINDELLAMNADPAYLQHGIVQIPQPSYVMKHPVTPSVTPGELLTNTYVN